MPHYKTLIKQDYIGAWALAGEDLTVTIKSVSSREVTMTGGKKDDRLVAVLEGKNLPLILNATNLKSIEKLYGSDTNNWAGKEITLFPSTTSLKGETVDCLRIRPTVGAPKKKAINEDRFSKALSQIKANEFTVAKLHEKFELTPEQQDRLPKQIEGETA